MPTGSPTNTRFQGAGVTLAGRLVLPAGNARVPIVVLVPVLRTLDTPELWILGGEDPYAPSAETVGRLHGLQKAGRPISLAVFPHAEHGIYEYDTQPDGTRLDTRNSGGYFDMMCDYIRDGKLHARYGDAVLSGPGQSAP